MTRRELDAAGIGDQRLRAAYEQCRQLHAVHGRTYFLATRLLPPARRPPIHALYGFARWVDDLVDEPPQSPAERIDELDAAVRAALRHRESDHPVLAALVDVLCRYEVEHAHVTDFLTSMRMDLTVTDYPTRAALEDYVHGSGDVIGLQVLPVLGTTVPREQADPHAAALGNAFQMTNFVRDVGEDLDRGRVYLPADELAAFGVDRERLMWCRRRGRPDAAVRRALSDQVARTRAIYRRAEPGIAMLDPVSRPCVATAYTLYGEILDRIVESGYDVFRRRLAVSRSRRAGAVLPVLGSVATARCRRRFAAG